MQKAFFQFSPIFPMWIFTVQWRAALSVTASKGRTLLHKCDLEGSELEGSCFIYWSLLGGMFVWEHELHMCISWLCTWLAMTSTWEDFTCISTGPSYCLPCNPFEELRLHWEPQAASLMCFARLPCTGTFVAVKSTAQTSKLPEDELYRKETPSYLPKSYWLSERKSQSLGIYSIKCHKTIVLKSQECKARGVTKRDAPNIPVPAKINYHQSNFRVFSLV